MSKIRDEALYGMFSFSACHILFSRSWLFDYGENYEGYDQGKALTFGSFPQLTNITQGRDVRKSVSE